MLAEKNESIAEATETVYKLSEEEMLQLQYEAKIDYYRRQNDKLIQWKRLKDGYDRNLEEFLIQKEEIEQRIQQIQQEIPAIEQQIQEFEQDILETKQEIQAAEQHLLEMKPHVRVLKSTNEELSVVNKKLEEQVSLLTAELEELRAKQTE